ncbi:Uncharacterised protein [Mycobacteroides abscessus subsp. abscessus]|nr:Uncharacterised protein [Mycobacteroides abscessus subsp. abscessus]
MPIPPSSMIRAAQIPVSSDICAFQPSVSVRASMTSSQSPPAPRTTSCSGRLSSMAPLASPRSRLLRPNSGSTATAGCELPAAAAS